MRGFSLLLCLGLLAWPVMAKTAADDPTEVRMRALTEELRCLVCQNQTLADSGSDLAADLRMEIRGMMEKGESDQQIIEFLTQRYGDFILYKPPVKATTWFLWFGPFLLGLGAVAALIALLRRRQKQLPESALSDLDRARLHQLMESALEDDKTP